MDCLQRPPHKPVVLAVDDEPTDIELLEVALEANGFDIDFHSVVSGEEALGYLRQSTPGAELGPGTGPRPDLILLDLKMPGMRGHDCLRAIKNDTRLQDIPVIVVTTSDLESDRNLSSRLGSAGYVVKCADLDAFIAGIRDAVGRYIGGDAASDPCDN